MSLLNDMLRDLNDRRQDGGASSPSFEAVPKQRRFLTARVLVAVGALGLLMLVVAGLWRYQLPPLQTDDLQASVKEIRIPVVRVSELEPLMVVPRLPEPTQESVPVFAPIVVEEVAKVEQEIASAEPVSIKLKEETDALSAAAPQIQVPQVELPITAPKTINRLSDEHGQSAVIRSQPQLLPEQAAFQRGLNELQRGDSGSAVAHFHEALRIKPDFLAARLQLVSVLQQTAPDAVADVLREGLEQQPEQPLLRKLYAQHLLQQKRLDEAVALLARAPLPTIEGDPEYHALLAALLQETQAFEAAAQVYGRLLQYRPQEALWWMGLAISLEQQGAITQAKEAYQSALAVSGLRPDLERYVRSRLQVL